MLWITYMPPGLHAIQIRHRGRLWAWRFFCLRYLWTNQILMELILISGCTIWLNSVQISYQWRQPCLQSNSDIFYSWTATNLTKLLGNEVSCRIAGLMRVLAMFWWKMMYKFLIQSDKLLRPSCKQISRKRHKFDVQLKKEKFDRLRYI